MDQPIVFPDVKTVRDEVVYDLGDRLKIAVDFDDKDDFMLALKHPDFNKYRHYIDNLGVFNCDAIRIAAAVFEGETKGIYDVKDILGDEVSPLHLAASHAAPKLTKYFIQSGESVDAEIDVPNCNLEDATPLDLALASIESELFYVFGVVKENDDKVWTKRLSIMKLLVFVCENSVCSLNFRVFHFLNCSITNGMHLQRRGLEVVRLLVQNTQNRERVRQAFIGYANNGKLAQLAALFLAAPDLFLPSTFLSLRDGLPSLGKRTNIQEGTSLLLDVFAAVGDKLVAYIRVEDPIVLRISKFKPEKIISFLLREVAYDKLGVSSRNDYFLRFFKTVDQLSSPHMPKLHQNITLPNSPIVSSQMGSNDINIDDINREFPSLKPDDAAVVYRAIGNKLSSMSRLHGLFLENDIRSTERQNYLPEWFPTNSGRNFELALESYHIKAASTTPKFDSKLALAKSLEYKAMQPNSPWSVLKQSNIPMVFKRFIRR